MSRPPVYSENFARRASGVFEACLHELSLIPRHEEILPAAKCPICERPALVRGARHSGGIIVCHAPSDACPARHARAIEPTAGEAVDAFVSRCREELRK